MDYKDNQSYKGASGCDTDPNDHMTTSYAEKVYSTVSYGKEHKIDKSTNIAFTMKSKYARKAQSNGGADDNTARSNHQSLITVVSKLRLTVVIVAMVAFMVVVTIASSAITAIVLRQKFENDLKRVKEEIQSLHLNNLSDTDMLLELLQHTEFGGSSTYVRWGRTTCPGNGTELVYEGYAGGSYFTDPGAAVDYLCLPKDPDWGHYEDALQGGGLVYGAEYEYEERDSSHQFFDSQTSNLKNNDVPCAVCRSTRSSVLMVPAKNQCHPGWTHEYHGYLSSGSWSHDAASEYVCVDVEAELLSGGATNHNGILFYFVEGRCGSLKCPPYVDGRELTCVVCTK